MDVFLLHSRLRRGRKRASVECGAPQDRPAAERTIPAGYELVKRNINRSKPDQIKQVRREIESDSEEPGLSPPPPFLPSD